MRRKAARASEPRARFGRRAFLRGALGLLAWPLAARAPRVAAEPIRATLPPETLRALETSRTVYVSPLLADGRESSCHGEVWYDFIDGAVVLTTSRTSWKARSLAKGYDTARIWVGDHGRWKRIGGKREAFRDAPSFDARASRSTDPALVDRLLASFEVKYPEEIGRWRDRMRRGHASGERVLIRYQPASA